MIQINPEGGGTSSRLHRTKRRQLRHSPCRPRRPGECAPAGCSSPASGVGVSGRNSALPIEWIGPKAAHELVGGLLGKDGHRKWNKPHNQWNPSIFSQTNQRTPVPGYFRLTSSVKVTGKPSPAHSQSSENRCAELHLEKRPFRVNESKSQCSGNASNPRKSLRFWLPREVPSSFNPALRSPAKCLTLSGLNSETTSLNNKQLNG